MTPITRAGVGTSVSEAELGFSVATQAELETAEGKLTTHAALTKEAHGITDTSKLATEAFVTTPVPGHKSGYYYPLGGVPTTGAAFTKDRMFIWPILVRSSWEIDRVGNYVSEGKAGATVRFGLYAANTDGTPGSLLHDWGTVAATEAGEKDITVEKTLSRGVYWIATAAQGENAALVARVSLDLELANYVGIPTPANAGFFNVLYRDEITGALPDPAGTIGTTLTPFTNSVCPNVYFRTK